MRGDTALAIMALAIAVILSGITNLIQGSNIKQLRHATVYAICNQARQETSGTSERACGDMQDQTNTEFLCQQRNGLASNHCWVEDK